MSSIIYFIKAFFRSICKLLFWLVFIGGIIVSYTLADEVGDGNIFLSGVIITIIVTAWTGMVLEFFDNVAIIRDGIIQICNGNTNASTAQKAVKVNPSLSSWTCSHCMSSNVASSIYCSNCGKPKPKS